MTYTNTNGYQNNSQAQPTINTDDNYWQTPRTVKMIRFTKTKPNRDGNGQQRGVLIEDLNGQQRWVSEHPNNTIFKLNWGSTITFNGINQRPSLTTGVQQTPPPINNSQARADYYNRMSEPSNQYNNQYSSLGDSIEQSYTAPSQPEIDYNNPPQPPTNNQVDTVNETLLETCCLGLSNAFNLMKSLNPQLDDDCITKLAISAYIAYNQILKDNPF